MKIAIPIWEDRISPVLDAASRLLIVEVVDQEEASRFETYLEDQELTHRCVRIRELGIHTLICGAVSNCFSKMLEASGIDIIPGISGHPEAVLDAYLRGNLCHSKFLMPGFHRDRPRHWCRQSSSSLRGNKRTR
jgi:predicted Fe-Mo cluster-binding NifX family protein